MKSDFDNPMVAGFGAATADDPPYPAQQHLDATDGQKTPDVRVREASGRTHTIAADGAHVEGDGADGSDGNDPVVAAVAERDYEAKGVTKAHLEAEIDRRNEGRDESILIDTAGGTKAEMVAALVRDDVIADAISDQDYEADGVTRAHLEAEIDRRNATRADADKISKDGDESDLINSLQDDDDAA